MKLKFKFIALSIILATQSIYASQIKIGDNSSAAEGAIAIGDGAKANPPPRLFPFGPHPTAGTSIAIGKNATAGNSRAGVAISAQEGIAIGENAYAHADGIHIGGSKKKPTSRNSATVVGQQSFTDGLGSTVIGSRSQVDVEGGLVNEDTRGGFSTVLGSSNNVTLSSQVNNSSNGIAVVVAGAANEVRDGNAVAIIGTGNIVRNAFTAVDPRGLVSGLNPKPSAAAAQKVEMGSVGVFGGGNTAENVTLSLVSGVGNTVTGGNETTRMTLNNVVGYKNTVTNASHVITTGEHNNISSKSINEHNYVTALGQNNNVTDSENVQMLGRNHNVTTSGKDDAEASKRSAIVLSGLNHTVNASHNVHAVGSNHTVTSSGRAKDDNGEASYIDITGLSHTVNASHNVHATGGNHTVENSGNAEDAQNKASYVSISGLTQKVSASKNVTLSGNNSEVSESFNVHATGSGHNVSASGKLKDDDGEAYISITGLGNNVSAQSKNINLHGDNGVVSNASNVYATGSHHKVSDSGVFDKEKDKNQYVSLTGFNHNVSAESKNVNLHGDNGVVSGSANVYALGSYHNVSNSGVFGSSKTDNQYVTVLGLGHEISASNNIHASGRLHKVASGSKDVHLAGEQFSLNNVSRSFISGFNTSEVTVQDSNNSVVMGNDIKGITQLNSSVVMGNDIEAITKLNSSVVMGNEIKALHNVSNSVILGNNITVKDDLKDVVALGENSKVEESTGVALGSESVANRKALSGTIKAKENPDLTKNEVYAHKDADTKQKEAIEKTVQGELAAVSVGHGKGTRQITNVAAGTEDSDAVNVAQLKSVSAAVNHITHEHHQHVQYVQQYINHNDHRIDVIQQTVVQHEQKIHNAFDAIYGTNVRVGNINEELKAGIAGATAMSFLHNPERPGKSMISMGVAGYKNARAIAIGFASNSDNDQWSFKTGVSLNNKKDVQWGGSIGYQW